jgi:hypothetical protein
MPVRADGARDNDDEEQGGDDTGDGVEDDHGDGGTRRRAQWVGWASALAALVRGILALSHGIRDGITAGNHGKWRTAGAGIHSLGHIQQVDAVVGTSYGVDPTVAVEVCSMAGLGVERVEDNGCRIAGLGSGEDVGGLDVTGVGIATDQGDLIGGDGELVGGIGEEDGSGEGVVLNQPGKVEGSVCVHVSYRTVGGRQNKVPELK